MKIAIVGHGFVGKAVDYGFPVDNKILIDPQYGSSVEDLKGQSIDVAFICVPTPMSKDKKINGNIVKDCVTYLKENTNTAIIAIKSTITPDIVKELQQGEKGSRVIFNPEFLMERTYKDDFVNPDFHVFGGEKKTAEALLRIYEKYSKCKPCPVYFVTGAEASLIKYGINSFLASKVLWFNQFLDVVDQHGGDYTNVINAITSDERITSSHTLVPGHDGKRGFGGACFTKDTAALLGVSPQFSVLQEVVNRNNEYRLVYELDDREKEQNVHYDD